MPQHSKVRFAVISASGIARSHMDAIVRNRQAELRAVCDLDEEKARAAAASFGEAVEVYTDYREALKRDDIDAVVVAVPDPAHARVTIAALEAGKHVLCEKPMALTLEDCLSMVRAADRSGKQLMIGQVLRYFSAYRLAKRLIDQGEIGELYYLENQYMHALENLNADSWRLDPTNLRHMFTGPGSHPLDMIRWLAGGNPYEVFAYSNHKVRRDYPVDDFAVAMMRFPGDVIGKTMVSQGCVMQHGHIARLYGSEGTMDVDSSLPYIKLHKRRLSDKQRLVDAAADSQVALTIPVGGVGGKNVQGEMDAFVEALASGRPVPVDGREGAATTALALAALESSQTGRAVRIDYAFLQSSH